MTTWERVCKNLGVDPVRAEPTALKILGPQGYIGTVETPEPKTECGYQDVECWVQQLRQAGWVPVSARTGKEVSGSTTWRAPGGRLYRGPYMAWTVMREETT